MPFYEYQCKKCDHRLEVLQKISDEPLVYCPECNEASLKKLISAAAFRLKGTGWYETDFKNGDKKKAKEKSPGSAATGADSAAGSSGGSSKGEASSDSKNDSKSAAKSGDSGNSAGASSTKSPSVSAST
jgi:putative FmdB family regulatory protein